MNSNEVITMLVNQLDFKQDNTDRNSFYKECLISNDTLLVIRLSNHRTYLSTWEERYKPTIQPSKKITRRMGGNLPIVYRKKIFYSFVFEDENTIGSNQVNSGRKIVVYENIHRTSELNNNTLINICRALKALSHSAQYNSEILGEYTIITNRTDENMNTNKKTIRLTETKLRSIIAESIKRVLETYDDEVKRKREIDNAWGEFKYDDPTYVEHNHPNRYNVRDNEYPTFNNALRGINGEEPEIDNEFDANLNIFSDRVGEQGATSMAALGHYGKEMVDVAKSIRTTPRQSYQAGTQIK